MIKSGLSYLNNIKAERVRAGLTQTYLAEKLGISLTSYCLKETGARRFTVDELILIANTLGTDPETLLKVPLV